MADGLARRTALRVVAAGVDISGDIAPYIESLTYTDNEEDETDDLQIVLSDAGGTLTTAWFQSREQDQSGERSAESGDAAEQWFVCAAAGAYLRTGRGAHYAPAAELPYGTIVEMIDSDGGWARVRHAGKTGYIMADCLKLAGGGAAGISVGDEVTVTGTPQYTAYGEGKPGDAVTAYSGEVTRINDKGAPYPVYVGYLGWFAARDVRKIGERRAESGDTRRSGGGGSMAVGVGGSFLGGVTKGLRLSAAIQSSYGTMDCGQFELDSVTASGPPAKISLKCTALPYDSSIRQTDKSKAWENYDLQGIAEEIAGRNGMACIFTGDNNPSYERVEQYKQSDIVFLRKLCKDAGCCLKCYNNIVNVIDGAWIDAQPPCFHIDRNGSNYIKYSLKTGKGDTYSDCEVTWTTADGECITGTATAEDVSDGQTLKITQKVSSVAEADALAEKELYNANKKELTANFTLMGNPALCAGIAVSLSGFGDWSGKYIIKKAVHSVGNGGYTTQIELRQV